MKVEASRREAPAAVPLPAGTSIDPQKAQSAGKMQADGGRPELQEAGRSKSAPRKPNVPGGRLADLAQSITPPSTPQAAVAKDKGQSPKASCSSRDQPTTVRDGHVPQYTVAMKDGEGSSQTRGGTGTHAGGPESALSDAAHAPSPGPSAKRSRSLNSTPSSQGPLSRPWQPAPTRDAIPFSGLMQEPPQLLFAAPMLRQSSTPADAGRGAFTPVAPVSSGAAAAAGASPRKCSLDRSVSTLSAHASHGASEDDENACSDVQALRKAVQAERARADREERNHAMLLEMMRGAEALMTRQAGEGLSGVAAIYSAANKLVTSDMLLHLPLSKAHMLANLQVEIKIHANTVLDALDTIHSLTRVPQIAPPEPAGQATHQARPPAKEPMKPE